MYTDNELSDIFSLSFHADFMPFSFMPVTMEINLCCLFVFILEISSATESLMIYLCHTLSTDKTVYCFCTISRVLYTIIKFL